MGLHDELWSGLAVVAAPGVEQAHRLDHAAYALLIFALPMLLSALIEAPIAVLSDRLPRRRLLSAGLLGLSCSLLICGLAHEAWLLSVGLALAGAASGVACGVAQAELVAMHPQKADRAMSRWTAFAAAGDLLAPLWVAGALALGASHRGAMVAVAALLGLHALAVLRSGESSPGACNVDDEPVAPLLEAVRGALGRKRLWWLLLACAMCTLLDEVVVALAALRLHETGWSGPDVALALAACSAGGVVGAVACEWALPRVGARAVLVAAGTTSCAALVLFVTAPHAWLHVAALLLLGAASAPHWPLLKAAAYETVPGSPGLVNALAQLFVGIDMALPWAIGIIASRYGLDVALLCLAAEPLAVLCAALTLLRSR